MWRLHCSTALLAALALDRGWKLTWTLKMLGVQAGWSATLPWLYYDTLASSVTKDLGISMRVSFKASTNVLGSTYDTMVFKLAKFSLNGTWLGMEDLSTQLLYCNMSAPFTDKGGGSSRSTRWLRFGYNSDVKYDCDFSQLLYHETFFYDLYLVDQVHTQTHPTIHGHKPPPCSSLHTAAMPLDPSKLTFLPSPVLARRRTRCTRCRCGT